LKRIHITVDSKGGTTVETKGFSGSQCVEASKFIEQALGEGGSRRTTAEFYAAGTSAKVQTKSGE